MGIVDNLLGNSEKAKLVVYNKKEAEKKVTYEYDGEFTVQYNPSSISIQAMSKNSDLQSIQNGDLANSYIQQNTYPTSTSLTVDIILDKVNNFDAFTSEKFKLSTSVIAGAAKKAIAAASDSDLDDYDVRPYVNALIGIIAYATSKKVEFCWNKMSFMGVLTSVKSKMTMFSPSGKPIRAKITISIQQSEEDDAANKKWDKAFDNMFGSMSVESTTSAVGKSKGFADQLGAIFNTNII